MKIVLATDAIHHPLTGIGRYAYELARGLPADPRIRQCLYFNFGRFVPGPIDVPQGSGGPALRSHLSRITPVVMAYRVFSAVYYRWRLRSVRDHLFHSPNYMVPPVWGPAVATIHDLSHLRHPQYHPAARVALLHAELPRTLQRASHLITVSEFVRREVIDTLGLPEHRVFAVHNGVDARFAPLSAAQTRPVLSGLGLVHGSYLLCVATIEPRKNIDTLLDAYLALPAALRERVPLVVAGASGWNSEALHRRLRDAAPQGVRYLAYVPEASLPALYAGARAFALASFYEGYGLPVIEAMASGVPVVVSDAASLPEVAGPDALRVNPHDADAWRQALLRAVDDAAWRSICIASGLQRAQAATWQQCVTRTVDVYQRAAAA